MLLANSKGSKSFYKLVQGSWFKKRNEKVGGKPKKNDKVQEKRKEGVRQKEKKGQKVDVFVQTCIVSVETFLRASVAPGRLLPRYWSYPNHDILVARCSVGKGHKDLGDVFQDTHDKGWRVSGSKVRRKRRRKVTLISFLICSRKLDMMVPYWKEAIVCRTVFVSQ